MKRFKRALFSIIQKGSIIFALFSVTMLSVGAVSDNLTDSEKIKLVSQWAEENNYETYTVSCRDSRIWLISEQKETSYPIIPKRVAQEVHFSENAIASVDAFNADTVIDCADSLETFKILFDNTLGLPDIVSLQISSFDENQIVSESVSALKMNLQLDSACEIKGGVEYAVRENVSIKDKPNEAEVYIISFPDSSKVKVTVLHQLLLRDWTDENGANDRSATDITTQFARGVLNKSGQYVYPILSTKLQNEMIEYQKNGGEEWYWKLGGSSPSYRDFVVLPTDKADTCTVVFQKYGGGIDDYRAAYTVTTGKQNNRTVITNVQKMVLGNYTYSQLFHLYYDTGLNMPTVEMYDLDTTYLDIASTYLDIAYNIGTYRDLLQPDTAAPVLFSYCDDSNDIGMISNWCTVDTVSDKTDTTCIVHLKFEDNSTPVAVQMKKTENFWLATGIADSAQDITSSEDSFADVPADAYYASAVQWAVKQGITAGTSETMFSPDTPCTNEQILAFLWRTSDSSESTIASSLSADHDNTVLWAFNRGLVSDLNFDADAPCTRAMAMTYLWKIAGSPTVSVSFGFTDVPVNESYAQAIAWAVENGVTTGTSVTTFSPDTVCTRAQIITFIHRAKSLYIF